MGFARLHRELCRRNANLDAIDLFSGPLKLHHLVAEKRHDDSKDDQDDPGRFARSLDPRLPQEFASSRVWLTCSHSVISVATSALRSSSSSDCRFVSSALTKLASADSHSAIPLSALSICSSSARIRS